MTDPGAFTERVQSLGIPLYVLDMQPSRPSLRAARRLVGLLRQERPAILQTWLYHADLLGLVAARLAGMPTVAWNIRASNIDTARYHRLTAWTIRACARLSSRPRAVVVNSEAGRSFHTRLGYRPREWVLIPNGVDTDAFRPDEAARAAVRHELGIAPEDLLIGLVGRFDPMKDHETFLRAAGRLSRRRPDVRFLLAGDNVTPENDLLARVIDEEGLGDRAYLLGERQDVPRLLAALDIAASSSYGEGFPNVVAEAMACGIPCVVTDVGDSARIVGDTGHVVPPTDAPALAAALEAVVELGAAGRLALGGRARRRIEEHFPLGEMVRRYEELYERLGS